LLPLLGSLGAVDFAGWVAGPMLDIDAYEGADVLEELVDGRLVEVQSGAGHHARYRLHDLVGAFAREVLVAEVPAQDRVEAQSRLLRCWLFLARQAHEREYGGDYTALHSGAPLWPLTPDLVDEMLTDPMAWFESERTNLVAAVRRAAELDEYEVCWDLAVTSVTLFERRAHRKDWRETHEVALEAAARHSDARAIAAVRWSSAGLALAEHRLADAVPDLSVALEYFEGADEPHGRGLALRSLAFVDRLQGRHERARERYQRAIQDVRSVGDRATEAHILGELADICSYDGQDREAEATLKAALEICTEVGVRRVEAQVHRRLGDLYLARGEVALAEQHFSTMRTIVVTSGDRFGYAHALRGLGAVRLAQGRYEPAEVLLGDALTEARRAGARLNEGRALLALAELAHRTGDKKAAAGRLDSAEALFRQSDATELLQQCATLRREMFSD
jgi:tetratricopeptide (TPR) repeat protein